MKIGFDAKRITHNSTGLGNYCRTLVNELKQCLTHDDQLLLYSPDKGRDELRALVTEDRRTKYVFPKGLVFGFERALWRSDGIVKDLKHDDIDIYHGMTGELPKGIHKSGIATVVTIHDLIFMRHPEYYSKIDAWLYAKKFRRTCGEADHFIAISECTKRDIIQLGHVDERKISVIYQSCDPRYGTPLNEQQLQAARLNCGLPKRYVLSVGTIEERKNIALAVKALRMLPDDVHFVAVGRQTRYAAQVLALAEEMGIERRVHLLSGMSDEQLQAIYQLAEVFVYPSRYEGFGIPIIEAIQCGLPVVAATGSCLEEAGGPDTLYVQPDDVEGMAQAIRKQIPGTEGREERIRRSREYVKRFEGNNVAQQVAAIYQKVYKMKR
jgi:glycosyltransferase involved in cell wall biosynthesis